QGGAADVIGNRRGDVGSPPGQKVPPQSQVDILKISKKVLVQAANVGEHRPAIHGRSATARQYFAGDIKGGAIAVAMTQSVSSASNEQRGPSSIELAAVGGFQQLRGRESKFAVIFQNCY